MAEFEFEGLDAEEEELIRSSAARGKRVASPILAAFLKSGLRTAKMKRENIAKTGMEPSKLVASIRQFAKSREMKINALYRGGEVYLMRIEDETPPTE